MSDERTLLEEGNLLITTSRAVIYGTTYPISGITSVGTRRIPPSLGGAFVLMGLGALIVVLATLGGMAGMSHEVWSWSDVQPAVIFGSFGAAALMLGVYTYRQARALWAVILGTASGEKRAMTTHDQDLADRVRAALDDAIIARG